MVYRENVLFCLSILVAIQVFIAIVLITVVLDMYQKDGSREPAETDGSRPNLPPAPPPGPRKTRPLPRGYGSGRKGLERYRKAQAPPKPPRPSVFGRGFPAVPQKLPSTTTTQEYSDGLPGFGFKETSPPPDAVVLNYYYYGNGHLTLLLPKSTAVELKDEGLLVQIVKRMSERLGRAAGSEPAEGQIWFREKELLKMKRASPKEPTLHNILFNLKES